MWIAAAILPLLAAAVAALIGRSGEARAGDVTAGARAHEPHDAVQPAADPGSAIQPGSASDTDAPRGAWRGTLRPGLGLMLVNFGYVALLSFGAAAATAQHAGVAALVIPVFGVGVIASRTVLASVPDRFGAPRTLSGAVVLEAAGLAGLAVATSAPVAVLSLVVMAVGQGLAVPSLGLLALASVPPSRHGRTAGAFFAYFDAGVGLGGPVVGLAARAADPTGALIAAAGAVLAAAPIALVRRGESRARDRCGWIGSSRNAST